MISIKKQQHEWCGSTCMCVHVCFYGNGFGACSGRGFRPSSVVATKPGSAVFLAVSGHVDVPAALPVACKDRVLNYSFSLCFGAIMTGVFMACMSADTQEGC